MKYIKKLFVAAFFLIILLPVFAFNFEENAISEIDNRALAGSPFSGTAESIDDYPGWIESYVSDRIGFRDVMIQQYTMLNNKAFHLMLHPLYMYGKDDYVFSKGFAEAIPTKEHYMAFAHMIREMQSYCEARNTPFVFAFTPTKHSVLPEYIPEGIYTSHAWVDDFLAELDRLGVNYVDNTKTLQDLHQKGEVVFNKKFDSNHWSELGAFYGTNALLERMHQDNPAIVPNKLEDFQIAHPIMESLLVSKFPINEEIVTVRTEHADKYLDHTSPLKEEIWHNPSYGYFTDVVNPDKPAGEFPRVMMFHGSHYMGAISSYIAETCHEFIGIHNYENAADFPYYYNIFKPDYVVFEYAEHTLYNIFNDEKMLSLDPNPTLEHAKQTAQKQVSNAVSGADVTVEQGEALTKIKWKCQTPYTYTWLSCTDGTEFDMYAGAEGYEVTLLNEVYEKYKGQFSFAAQEGDTLTTFQITD